VKRDFSWLRALGLVAAIGCVQPASAEVVVSGAWVRGTVEGQTSTVAYMTLKSDVGARLLSAASTSAARCTLHRMTMEGNVMRMRALDVLPIPPGGAVQLQEGHDHLMLEGLARALKEGETVELTLQFVDASGARQTVKVQAPVRPVGASR
jgi:hypothetical protein